MTTVQKKIAKRRSDMPAIYRKTYDKAMTGKNRAAGVKAFCLECMCWQKQEIKQCTAPQCPLYPYRPYSKSKD
jgi:hypothetical protein